MSIARKLKSVLLTYSFVISISINLLPPSSEADGGPPPPPPPIEGLNNFKSPWNQSGDNPKEDQSQHNNKSRTTSSTNTPPPQPLEVPTPTGEFGKKYAELIKPNTSQQNLMIEFPKKITSLIRNELTLKHFAADANKILTIFSEKDTLILDEAKEKYKELIQDPYIAQFTNKNQKTGDFLDNKLFEESQEEATLRLLSLEQLEEQKKQEILNKQGDILEQLKFINEHSQILGKYGEIASADISKKLPEELPKILSKQGEILGQLKFINEHSKILGPDGKTASIEILKKLPKELPKILNKQGDILEQLKFINEYSEILGENSKATLKDILKKLPKKLDQISSKQLVGFILDENHINTNLQDVSFSKKEVREQVDNLNNKILEKIFLKDDGEITEQDLTKISQKYKETDLIKRLTQTMVYIEGNKNSNNKEALNKTLEKGLENTTPEQRELFLNVLTDNTRIQKVFIEKIERERKQEQNKKNLESKGALLNDLENALKRRTSRIPEQQIERTIEQQITSYQQKTLNYKKQQDTVWIPFDQNYNRNAQNENNQKWKDENQNAQNENNNDVDEITKANQELVQAVHAATRKFSEMSSLLKDNTIKNATSCQGYLKGAEEQLTLAREKGQELIENSVQAFTIIPKEYQDNMDKNWQDYLSPEEITELDTLNEKINTLHSKKNSSKKFTSKTDSSEFKTKQEELQILSERLRADVVTKQKKQLVQKYVDEMVTNAKKAVGKIEATLDGLKKKEENKHDNTESVPVISKEILKAQKLLKEAESTLERIQFKHKIAQKRYADSSDEDSDDDWDDNSDKKAEKRKKELENAKKALAQAQKDLENAKAEDKADKVEAECLEDMASMFKNAEDEAEQKEEAERQRQEDLKRKQNEAERQRQEDLKRKQNEANRKAAEDEAKRKADKAEAECLGDMASMFKNAEDEANKAAEDEAKRKADKVEAECLEDMASMFKNAEDEAEQKEEAERQRQEDLKRKQNEAERQRQEDLKRKQNEANRKAAEDEAERQRQEDLKRKQNEAERQRQEDLKRKQNEAERQRQEDLKRKQNEANRKAAEDEANKAAEDEAKRKADKAEAECLGDMASMFKNAEDEANKAAEDEAKRKADKVEAECLEDMASMFKNAEDEAEQKEEAERQRQEDLKRKQNEAERQRQEDLKRKQNEAERQRQEDLKRKQNEANRKAAEDEANKAAEDEAKRKADKVEAECLEDMASMFKNAEDEAEQKEEAERQRQEDLKRKQNEANRKAAEDEAKRKADKAEAECLGDMASMFKNAEDEANKAAEDEAKRKADKAEAECLGDMASMFKNAEEEAEEKAKEDAAKTKAEADRKAKEDKGYKTDEEELEEINNTTEEELKKDMLLESEDTAIDIPLKTEKIVEQDDTVLKEQISNKTNETVALLEGVDRMTSVTNKHIYSNIFNNRLNITSAIGAGDEDTSIITRGIWISGLYGINKQGAWKNIPKYQGRTTGVTIGLDAAFINSHDVIGIAYSRLESQVKYNKKLGKTAVNGHLLSIYGLKELIKGFSLQAITSYGHNYIKNKTTGINNLIGKYQNNNVSFETLLNYKHRTKYDLHFIPSLGFKYDYSRASNYKEYNIDIENLMIQKKSNQSLESSIGGKIVFKPIRIINNITLTPSLHGNIEHHFYNKNTKVNAKATFKGQTLEKTIILPKQPKLGYNLGSNILMSRKNIHVLLEYNYYTHRKYQSHQGLVKLKVNL